MSLQTLHPTSFDEGFILDQTPWPGIDVPEDCDYARLLKMMQPLGAEMLVNAIQKRWFLPPRNGVPCAKSIDHARGNYKLAPKLGTAHRLLNFETMDSAHVLRMSRAFESTWAFAAVPTSRAEVKRQRIIFPGPFCIISPSSDDPGEIDGILEVPPGLPYLPHDAASGCGDLMNHPLLVNTVDGKTISTVSLKVEGGVQMVAHRAALKHRLMGQPCKLNGKGVITFHEALTAQP
jgi:methionyl-tRNA formyltransferase